MKQYGLIGKQLGHSWSERYFTEKFAREGVDAQYRLYETEDVQEWLSTVGKTLDGFNVTIPYKRTILPLLDEVDSVAAEIGAVNVVRVVHEANGTRFVGYNTDWMGVKPPSSSPRRGGRDSTPIPSGSPNNGGENGMKVVILGRGGAALAVKYAIKPPSDSPRRGGRDSTPIPSDSPRNGGEVMMWHLEEDEWVNEIGEKGIEDAIRTCDVIVNATPVGMSPKVTEYPQIPYEAIQRGTVAFDCIYNPVVTEFMRRCQAQGAVVQNGLEMLRIQAEEAWRIWKD